MTPAASQPEPLPTAVEIVQSACNAFRDRDAAVLFARVSPDITVFATDLVSWGGLHRGISEVFARFTALMDGGMLGLEVERLVPEGEEVLLIGRVHGVIRELGLTFDLPLAALWTVQRGAIMRVELYTSSAAISLASGRTARDRAR